MALCLTDNSEVLEGNTLRHEILRMLKFHHITAFMNTYPNFKKTIFEKGYLV